MKEHFKGVVWPKESLPNTSGTVYRYVVVGMIVTDQPIPEFNGKNEVFLDGTSFDVGSSLACVMSRKPKFELGDASDVLLSLKDT